MATAYRTLAERPVHDEPRVEPPPVIISSSQLDPIDDDEGVVTVRFVSEQDEPTPSFGVRVVLWAVMLLSALTVVVAAVHYGAGR